MKFLSLVTFCLCLLFGSVQATQIIEIDSKRLLKCSISSRHHNRISVDGKRIKKVIYPEGDVSIRIEEETGQIFVQALVDRPEATTVSIITSEGSVQDLELSFVDKASEILILQERPFEEELRFPGFDAVVYGDEVSSIQNVVEMLLAGALPDGYIAVEDSQICYRVKNRVMLRSKVRLVGPFYTIYMLVLANEGRRDVRLHESEINCVDGEWVFLERHEIRRNEKMLAIIGVKTCE